MPELYLDCAFGMGGDMFLAALADLGLDLIPLERIFTAPLPGIQLQARRERRQGVVGRRLVIEEPGGQPLRTLPDLLAMLDRLDVSDQVKENAGRAFTRLAEVEGQVHGIEHDLVHFHEVGAVDTLVDVVGAFWGLETLGVTRVKASPLPWFHGTVDCAHGRMPLPAPATARLLAGKPVYPTDAETELITPTAALLLDQLVTDYAPGPHGTLRGMGTGYGTRHAPGGLRAVLVEPLSEQAAAPANACGLIVEQVWVLESHVDHLTGEELGAFFPALQEAGALDVLFLPGVMKKNRPGGALRVICGEEHLEAVQAAFFRHSLTLGLRRSRMERVVLPRRAGHVESAFGPLEAKDFELEGRWLHRPEHEALRRLAEKTGRSVAELRFLLAGEES